MDSDPIVEMSSNLENNLNSLNNRLIYFNAKILKVTKNLTIKVQD